MADDELRRAERAWRSSAAPEDHRRYLELTEHHGAPAVLEPRLVQQVQREGAASVRGVWRARQQVALGSELCGPDLEPLRALRGRPCFDPQGELVAFPGRRALAVERAEGALAWELDLAAQRFDLHRVAFDADGEHLWLLGQSDPAPESRNRDRAVSLWLVDRAGAVLERVRVDERLNDPDELVLAGGAPTLVAGRTHTGSLSGALWARAVEGRARLEPDTRSLAEASNALSPAGSRLLGYQLGDELGTVSRLYVRAVPEGDVVHAFCFDDPMASTFGHAQEWPAEDVELDPNPAGGSACLDEHWALVRTHAGGLWLVDLCCPTPPVELALPSGVEVEGVYALGPRSVLTAHADDVVRRWELQGV